jgi:hypothetical protein
VKFNRFFLIKPTDALISQIYFVKKLYVSGNSSAHPQEFSIIHSAMVCHAALMTTFKKEYDGTAVTS